jgi:hypothetical protein
MTWDPTRAQPKGKPAKLLKEERDKRWQDFDEKESEKVRKRAKKRCEVTVAGKRCNRPIAGTGLLAGVHHHIGGWGLRGRGESALAINKTLACHNCHKDIEANVLEHIKGNHYRSHR